MEPSGHGMNNMSQYQYQ
jgi:hypothetical protein